MLKALFEAIVEQVGKAGVNTSPTSLDINGRRFIRTHNGGYSEVAYHQDDTDAYLAGANVVDLTSLITWANAAGGDGEILVSRAGTSFARSPRRTNRWHSQNKAEKVFYDEFMPQNGLMSFVAFKTWLDRLGDRIEDHEGVEAELDTLSAFAGTSGKVKMTGGVIKAMGENKTEVVGGMRRYIGADIPFGDPGFSTKVMFLVSAASDRNGELHFTAEHLVIDGALDRYVEWARERCAAELPDGWIALATPLADGTPPYSRASAAVGTRHPGGVPPPTETRCASDVSAPTPHGQRRAAGNRAGAGLPS